MMIYFVDERLDIYVFHISQSYILLVYPDSEGYNNLCRDYDRDPVRWRSHMEILM